MENFIFMKIFLAVDFMLIFIMILPSNLYYFHPLTLGLILVFYVMVIAFKMNFMLNSYWYSYILFLVMIGGLLILFLYFTSLTNNELFFFQIKFNLYQSLKFMFILILFYFFLKFYWMNYIYQMNYYELVVLSDLKNFDLMILFKNLMMDYFLSLNIYMIIYLFFMMVSVVVICGKVGSPLRQLKDVYEWSF
uniref:NADH dehydrogenase subunit 6 n=1 Tax=Euurobracon breviterebrae TaxID=1421601 RepID=A0A0A6ZL00_9HYME|nr:NADH dehydrogenase subunit 6 [Euurobracon breviterebrae]